MLKFSAYTQATTFDFSIRNTPFADFTFKDTPELTSLVFDGDFTSVDISGNAAVTSVDLSLLTGLTRLDAHSCGLQSLDVTKNLALESLDCSGNSIPSLNVVNNTALRTLNCSKNNLIKINVAANTALEDFNISDNGLSAINLRSNTALKKLNVSGNKEISLVDLRNNTLLEELYASGLSISELDLTKISQIFKLDIKDNDVLQTVICNSKEFFVEMLLFLFDSNTFFKNPEGNIVYGPIQGLYWAPNNNICPDGWGIPDIYSLKQIIKNHSPWTNVNGKNGYWLSGENEFSEDANAAVV